MPTQPFITAITRVRAVSAFFPDDRLRPAVDGLCELYQKKSLPSILDSLGVGSASFTNGDTSESFSGAAFDMSGPRVHQPEACSRSSTGVMSRVHWRECSWTSGAEGREGLEWATPVRPSLISCITSLGRNTFAFATEPLPGATNAVKRPPVIGIMRMERLELYRIRYNINKPDSRRELDHEAEATVHMLDMAAVGGVLYVLCTYLDVLEPTPLLSRPLVSSLDRAAAISSTLLARVNTQCYWRSSRTLPPPASCSNRLRARTSPVWLWALMRLSARTAEAHSAC